MTDKIVFIRRKFDGAILQIPERDLYGTMKTGNFEEVLDANKVYENSLIEFPTHENDRECPFCGKWFNTKEEVITHKHEDHKA